MAASDAKTVPIKNTAYRVTFPIFDADGDLVTGATGLDSEISKDGGTFADCTNEATEIATSSGMYFLDLTSTEMNADTVAIIVKTSTSGAKTSPIVLYPAARGFNDLAFPTTSGRSIDVTTGGEVGIDLDNAAGTLDAAQFGSDFLTAAKIADGAIDAATFAAGAINAAAIASDAITAAKVASDVSAEIADAVWDEATSGHTTSGTFGQVVTPIRAGTAQAGAAGSITLDASASSTTDFYKGAVVYITGGTGVGQSRVVTAYNGTTKVATVAPNWATNPDNTSVFAVLPDADPGSVQGNVTGSAASVTGAVGSVTGAVGSVTGAVGSVTGNVGGNVVGSVASVTGNVGGNVTGNVSGNVTGSVGSVASGGITAATFAAGAIDATAIAANAITAAKIATDAIGADELADGAITATTFAAGAVDATAIADGAIDAATFAAGAITAAAIAADAIGASELATDGINEIRDAVWAKTMTELASIPGVTGTVLEAVSLRFLLDRNKRTQTATTELLRNDADNATIATWTKSDDGTTFIRGEGS